MISSMESMGSLSLIQSSKSSIIHNHPEQDSFTTNLVAQSYGEALKVIKKVIVRKNGGLTILFTEPVELLSGSVVINSPNMTLQYLVKNAKIGKKSISWGGGGQKFPQDKLLRVDTSNLSGQKYDTFLRAPQQGTFANPAPYLGPRVIGFAKPITDSAVTAASYGGLANPAAASQLEKQLQQVVGPELAKQSADSIKQNASQFEEAGEAFTDALINSFED